MSNLASRLRAMLYEDIAIEVDQLEARLAEAERLLREIRNRPVGPAGYDSYPWIKVRSRIDAFLRPADRDNPAEVQK